MKHDSQTDFQTDFQSQPHSPEVSPLPVAGLVPDYAVDFAKYTPQTPGEAARTWNIDNLFIPQKVENSS